MTKAHADRVNTAQKQKRSFSNDFPASAGMLPPQSRNSTANNQAIGFAAVQEAVTDSFFYLEHPAVITYGRATPPADLLNGNHQIPTLAVPRGGLATYHAPGQLIGYIVMDLSRRSAGAKADIHAYLRALELGLIAFLKEEFQLDAGLREGFTGVWTNPPKNYSSNADRASGPGRKLASIGVSARKWITSHGFALNIHPDMTGFKAIVPCGITDAEMTSVELELQRTGQVLTSNSMELWAERAHCHIIKALQNEGWLT